jgi:hypothetical protein
MWCAPIGRSHRQIGGDSADVEAINVLAPGHQSLILAWVRGPRVVFYGSRVCVMARCDAEFRVY